MDDVELRLDLVAAHVVHGGDVLVEDQVFGGGWKPEEKHLCPDGVWISMRQKPQCGASQPLHPAAVLIRVQDRLWSHVDHQDGAVLRPSSLVPGPDDVESQHFAVTEAIRGGW